MKTFFKENWFKPIIIAIFIFLAWPISSFAHPGRTAADGCHYCRTNCDYWGVPWNTRHCHPSLPTPPAPASIPTTPTTPTTPAIPLTEQEITSVSVVRVIDGDTIEVKFENGALEKVRLIGIDTPETKDPRKPVECFGQEATKKMEELVNGKTIKLDRKKEENRDTYDRLLRFIYVGNTFVNAEMIKQGYAYAYLKYPFDSKLMEDFKSYEKEARENQRGLWAPEACANTSTEAATSSNSAGEVKGEQAINATQEDDKETTTGDIIIGAGILILFCVAIFYFAKKIILKTKAKLKPQ